MSLAKTGAGVATYLDERIGSNAGVKKNLRKVFPEHWSFMLGEIALYSFVILMGTGVYLTLWFKPSQTEVAYDGSYEPLAGRHDVRGVRVDAALELRSPRRPTDASDPPLVGADLHRRHRGAPAAHLLHRRVPQAA